MVFVILAIICSTILGVIFKLSEGHVKESSTMLLGNYVAATFISLMLWVSSGANSNISSFSLGLALVTGFVFTFNFFLMVYAVKTRGVALPVILMRLSAVVPITASILFFRESPQSLQVIGLIGALLSAVILSLNIKGGQQLATNKGRQKYSVGNLILFSMLMLFCFGIGDLGLRTFEELGQQNEKDLFFLLLFFVAMILMLLFLGLKKITPNKKDLLWGFALGIPNILTAYFIVTALKELPAFIVFPAISAGTVMTVSIVAAIFFKEKLGLWGVFGILLTIVSIVTMNAEL